MKRALLRDRVGVPLPAACPGGTEGDLRPVRRYGGVMRSTAILLPILLGILAASSAPAPASDDSPPAGGFLENLGQTDPTVRFHGTSGPATVFFEADGFVLVLAGPSAVADPAPARPVRARESGGPAATTCWAVKIGFEAERGPDAILGRRMLPARNRLLTGRNIGRPAAEVPSFGEIVYREAWPGIDLAVRPHNRGIAYTLEARAGADLTLARFRYEGARAVRPTSDGVVLETGAGDITHVPLDAAGRFIVSTHGGPFPADRATSATSTGDGPGMRWSTFLGDTRDESGYAIDLAADGRVFIAGATRSTAFPTTIGALDPSYNGSFDGFVTALAADGSTVLWSTLLGDAGDDRIWAMRLDAAGRPVVAGVTTSSSFPTTPGAFDTSFNGVYDAFVAVLAADGGSLVWSTFLGGSDREWDVSGLAIDGAGRIAVTGSTRSADFPVTTGSVDTTLGGSEDAFVAVVQPDGASLRYATFLGGSGLDGAEDIAFDASDRVVVVGRTYSSDFPVTAGAYQTTFAGGSGLEDGFVARLAPGGATLDFASYLGGSAADDPYALALNPSGAIVIVGSTRSQDFPTTAGVYAPVAPGSEDAFVSVMAASGAALLESSFFGGTSLDRALDLAIDSHGRSVLCGWTCSANLPTNGHPWDTTFNGPCDAFAAILDGPLTDLVYATYLGGDDDEIAYGLALDGADRLYLSGQTRSGDFPSTPGAYDSIHNSAYSYDDVFVTALWPIPLYCTTVTGESAPFLFVEKSHGDPCPKPPPVGTHVDLVEGDVDNLSATDIGPVRGIACGTDDTIFPNGMTPVPFQALFQLARRAGGAYTDGDGPGLVGSRVPVSGDCP
jgi:hypothetical protein